MAEDDNDDSQKTEDPTPRKLEEARNRGQVVLSREINNWVVLFTIAMLSVTVAPDMMGRMSDIMANFMVNAYNIPDDGVAMKQAVASLFLDIGVIVIVPLVILALSGALASFLQIGPLLTSEPIKPDLSKLSIIKGFSRVFSIKSFMEFIKGIIKITVVGVAVFMAAMPYLQSIEHFVGQEVIYAMFDLKTIVMKMMVTILSIMFFVAVGDYLFQRLQFMKQMRMSKQEIKEEYKQTEGDPYIKGRLRQLRMRRARQRMMQNVPKADVVITNPTHYAVALQYEMGKMSAPVMLAKGVDNIALRIKEIAKEHDISIVENPILARALHDSMEIDQVIPEEHFKAVAEVISYVFKLKGKIQ